MTTTPPVVYHGAQHHHVLNSANQIPTVTGVPGIVFAPQIMTKFSAIRNASHKKLTDIIHVQADVVDVDSIESDRSFPSNTKRSQNSPRM